MSLHINQQIFIPQKMFLSEGGEWVNRKEKCAQKINEWKKKPAQVQNRQHFSAKQLSGKYKTTKKTSGTVQGDTTYRPTSDHLLKRLLRPSYKQRLKCTLTWFENINSKQMDAVNMVNR